jgi:serine/threonine-protein kinase
VQQAVVAPISQVNPKVPPDLERIVNRALARDPAQRYQSARELAISLTEFLYRFGKAVSSFKIASLVQSTVKDKQRARPLQPSIIDKLIGRRSSSSLRSVRAGLRRAWRPRLSKWLGPVEPDRFQPRDWAREIKTQIRRRPAPHSVQAGISRRSKRATRSLFSF